MTCGGFSPIATVRGRRRCARSTGGSSDRTSSIIAGSLGALALTLAVCVAPVRAQSRTDVGTVAHAEPAPGARAVADVKGDPAGPSKRRRRHQIPSGGVAAAALCAQPVGNCQEAINTLASTSDRISQFVTADDFKPTQTGNVTSVCWTGGYLDFATDQDCSAGALDAFIIRYYTDNGGLPGTLIASFSQAGQQAALAVTGPSSTGRVLVGRVTEYEYTATHAPVPVVAGQRYWIEISNALTGCSWLWESGVGNGVAAQDGQNGPPGVYDGTDIFTDDLAFCLNLPLELVPRPANDECAGATAITGPGTFAFDITAATTDGPRQPSCFPSANVRIDSDVWYCWTADCTDRVFVRTCGLTAVDTLLAVYDGCGTCPPSTNATLSCNDDLCGELGAPRQSMVTFDAAAGQQYMIRVGRFSGKPRGPGSLEITCGPPDNLACPGTGQCCDPDGTGTAACDDELCCETVCACDPFCCDIVWDQGCATFGFLNSRLENSGCGALLLCGDRCNQCGSPAAGDCCLANGSPGCSDQACCDAVCALDSFCCDVEWDINCATQNNNGVGANVQCAALCPPVVCPAGTVAFDDPQSGTVDARQPHKPDDPAVSQNIDSILVQAPSGANRLECWSLCETSVEGTANSIVTIENDPGGGFRLRFARPISSNALTAVTYTDDTAVKTTGRFIAHSANVNADAAADMNDVTTLALILQGLSTLPLRSASADVDRTGMMTPADLLRAIDLLIGGGQFSPTLDTPLPASTATCPKP